MTPCNHDLAERETMVADGYCPVCMKDTLERLQAQIAEVRSRCDEVLEKPDGDNDIAYIKAALS